MKPIEKVAPTIPRILNHILKVSDLLWVEVSNHRTVPKAERTSWSTWKQFSVFRSSAVPQSSQNLCPNSWLHFSGAPSLYSLMWANITDMYTHEKCQACCYGSHKLCLLREGELGAEGDSKALTSVKTVWSHSNKNCRTARVTRISYQPRSNRKSLSTGQT